MVTLYGLPYQLRMMTVELVGPSTYDDTNSITYDTYQPELTMTDKA